MMGKKYIANKGPDHPYSSAAATRVIVAWLLCASLSLLVCGCKAHGSDVLRVGVTPGPAEDILHSIEPQIARQGLRLNIVPFTDYVQPNMALASHDVDANLYQNNVFLTQFNHDHQVRFVSISKVYLPLMGLYPGHARSLAALGSGARIAIPNDPVNHDRALLLLAKAGLITVLQADGAPLRITANPKSIKLVELDAAQLPRSLEDVDAAVINANFALDAGLNPARNALLAETRESPYANVLAVNDGSQNDSRLRTLAAALTSAEVRAFIRAHYGGAIYPAD